jgi:hypothetical protein
VHSRCKISFTNWILEISQIAEAPAGMGKASKRAPAARAPDFSRSPALGDLFEIEV